MSKSLAAVALNILVLPVDATDEVLVAGFCVVFAAEFTGLSREGGAVVRANDE
jgi:hypothetical protein